MADASSAVTGVPVWDLVTSQSLKCCVRTQTGAYINEASQTSHFPIPLIASSRDCTVVSAHFYCAHDLSGHPAQQQGWEECDSESESVMAD